MKERGKMGQLWIGDRKTNGDVYKENRKPLEDNILLLLFLLKTFWANTF